MKKEIIMDVPDESPQIPIAVTDVRITNQEATVEIKDPLDLTKYCVIPCNVEVGITLPLTKRGIHMSRIEQILYESSQKRYDSVQKFSQKISVDAFRSQTCDAAKVAVYGRYTRDVKTAETHLSTHQPFKILSEVGFDGKSMRTVLGMEAWILTACPCVQRYFIGMLSRFKKNKNSIYSTENLGSLITHTQRGNILLKIENNDDKITIKDLIDILEKTVFLSYELLKRPDERRLVLSVLRDPQFVEDIVRRVALETYKFLEDRLSNNVIEIKTISYESIHPHNVVAHLKTEVNKLRELVGT